jgi:hypothetical protein
MRASNSGGITFGLLVAFPKFLPDHFHSQNPSRRLVLRAIFSHGRALYVGTLHVLSLIVEPTA